MLLVQHNNTIAANYGKHLQNSGADLGYPKEAPNL